MSAPLPEPVTVERETNGVAVVTIDRARQYNTLSIETLEALDAVFVELSTDSRCLAVIVTGAGGESFAAGADLREVGALTPRSALGFAVRGQRVFDRIELAPQIVFAAIDGYCMGGGLDLALACDVRHASPRSTFAHPGSIRGIVTGFGGTGRLPRLVGRSRAIELFATGRRISADEALEMGLIDQVAENPLDSASAAAALIGDRWPEAAAWMKGSAVRWWRKGKSRR
jgi:enoyl-CoA hydratase/carnithine racemase